MTFDTHLINVAIAGIGISAGVAVLIALAVIGSFAWWKHNKAHDKPVTFQPIRHEEITQASLRQAA
ncbi:MAG TPA: hypothetical protein VFI65_10070 [Streptosporangiaceae bacterium]|nr:hypothetical protein [Streptosporangiaceae bacterium]